MNNTKRSRTIVLTIAVALIGICICRLFYLTKLETQEQIYSQLRQELVETAPVEKKTLEQTKQTKLAEQSELVEVEIEETANAIIDFDALKKINPDVYAWITIEGTQIDYPILQNEEDNYYLMRCIDGQSGYPGCIYTNSCSLKDFTSWNTVIYGHNMINGSMFGSLRISEQWSEETEYIDIITPMQKLRYRVYAVTEFTDEYLPVAYNESLESEQKQFLEDVKEAALQLGYLREGMEVSQEDRLVTLSTCIKNKEDKRLIVVGVLE